MMTSIFQIGDQTNTTVIWPSRIKVGAKSKKGEMIDYTCVNKISINYYDEGEPHQHTALILSERARPLYWSGTRFDL